MDHDTASQIWVQTNLRYKKPYSCSCNLIWHIGEKKMGGKVNNNITYFNVTTKQCRREHTHESMIMILITKPVPMFDPPSGGTGKSLLDIYAGLYSLFFPFFISNRLVSVFAGWQTFLSLTLDPHINECYMKTKNSEGKKSRHTETTK